MSSPRPVSIHAPTSSTILTACRAFVESPLPCMAGVTGSDLRKRIERIMGDRPSEALTLWKKTLVAALPMAAVVAPIVIGTVIASRPAAGRRSVAHADDGNCKSPRRYHQPQSTRSQRRQTVSNWREPGTPYMTR